MVFVNPMKRWTLLIVIAAPLAATAQQPESTPIPVPLTLYSPRGPVMRELPGRKSWDGVLWVDHRKIGFIISGQFLTLRLSEGDHALAGQTSFGHESSINTVISLHRGSRYFVRLVVDSKQIAGFGPTHFFAEPATCEEAYHEAAAMQPVKLKRIEKDSLEYVARESYFPECGQ
jgi:hypothetical protein